MISLERLSEILRESGATKDSEILPTDQLQADLMMNSMGLLMALVALEREYNMTMDLAAFVNVVTVEELLQLLRKKD